MSMSRRTLIASVTAAAVARPVRAQEKYPSRMIKMIVPFAAGGAVDPIARLMADRLQKSLGQTVVVENRPGAGGNIGSAVVAKSPADGYTLLATPSAITINPSLYAKMPYDLDAELTPLILISRNPMFMLAPKDSGLKSIGDLVARAKAEPGKLNYAISGNGTVDHLICDYFRSKAGIDIVKVPYQGVPSGVTALLRGEVSLMTVSANAALPYVKGEQVTPLAVTSDKRVSAAPGVPTMTENGFDNFVIYGWTALLGPAGMPENITEQLHQEMRKVLAAADVKELIAGYGGEMVDMSLSELKAYFRAQTKFFGELVRISGARIE